jgi:hypothetical protein
LFQLLTGLGRGGAGLLPTLWGAAQTHRHAVQRVRNASTTPRGTRQSIFRVGDLALARSNRRPNGTPKAGFQKQRREGSDGNNHVTSCKEQDANGRKRLWTNALAKPIRIFRIHSKEIAKNGATHLNLTNSRSLL